MRIIHGRILFLVFYSVSMWRLIETPLYISLHIYNIFCNPLYNISVISTDNSDSLFQKVHWKWEQNANVTNGQAPFHIFTTGYKWNRVSHLKFFVKLIINGFPMVGGTLKIVTLFNNDSVRSILKTISQEKVRRFISKGFAQKWLVRVSINTFIMKSLVRVWDISLNWINYHRSKNLCSSKFIELQLPLPFASVNFV